MKQINRAKILKKLKKELDEDRYLHTMGVMYTAASLAMRYGEDPERAMLAGALHDCAKCIPNDKKIRMCEEYGVEISEVEKRSPYLLHSKLGAVLAKERYDVTDQGVLDAITWHTTGRPDMTLLEKIIYLADYIEPGRYKAQNLPVIRSTAFLDLDLALYLTLRDTLQYLQTSRSDVDDMTRLAFEYYDRVIRER